MASGDHSPDIAGDSATVRGGFDHRMYHNALGKPHLILPSMSRRPAFFWTWIENPVPLLVFLALDEAPLALSDKPPIDHPLAVKLTETSQGQELGDFVVPRH